MYLDSPEDIVFDIIDEIMFKGTPLELIPILGTEKSLINFNEVFIDYYRKITFLKIWLYQSWEILIQKE